MLAWSIYFAAITKNVTILTNPKREETEGEGAGEDCVIPNWWRFMFNAKQAIIINYAPGCQSSALAIDIVPHRHTATTTTTKTETEAETTTSAITRETKVYKANTCLAFISFLEWAVAGLRTDATSGERIWLQLYEMRFGKCSKRRTNKKNAADSKSICLRLEQIAHTPRGPPHLPWQLSQQQWLGMESAKG